MRSATGLAIECGERGWLPDAVLRRGVRRLVRARLDEIDSGGCEASATRSSAFAAAMDDGPIAPLPEVANEQHYEVPSAFFAEVLGRHRKYSCCEWGEETESLDAAEAAALATTCARAGVENGMRVLELGCGWGSLTLWMASRNPRSRITAVSNSSSQRRYIMREAMRRGLSNVEVLTADMNRFRAASTYDRVVSVEMFEHMRNYRALFRNIHDWLVPGGRFFMHIFCHRSTPYAFEPRDDGDWMSRYFFSGGIMPSETLPLRFQDDLRVVDTWRWSGVHYERTANAWLANMDRHRHRVVPILSDAYGAADAIRWWMRWRIFFIACAELFGWADGQEWWVSHYLFERR